MASKQAPQRPLVRISEAAKAAGVSRQTVEYYITLGLISPLRRPGSRGRFFDRHLIRQIRIIRELNRTGLSLRAIRETYLQRWQKARAAGRPPRA
jgi:DNA-binding transcriptional MerR regulator